MNVIAFFNNCNNCLILFNSHNILFSSSNNPIQQMQ